MNQPLNQQKTKLKAPIGLLGGTFNPIHWGHLLPTKTIMSELNLSHIMLIPAHRPPHKQTPGVDSAKRAHMVKLACIQMQQQYHSQFEVNLLELERSKPSYTVETLKILQQQHPNTPLCFLMGMDSFINFHTWHQFEQIIELCHLVVSCRPGYQIPNNSPAAHRLATRQTDTPQDLTRSLGGKVYLANIEPIDVSSSQIREYIAANKTVDHLLPANVLAYINQMQLYRQA